MSGYDLGKLATMVEWCERYGLSIQTKGEVGFGRACVGILHGQAYVDYDYDLMGPKASAIWAPEDSYHKQDCLAVLVHDSDYMKAFDQLYEWVVWLIEHNIGVQVVPRKTYNADGLGRELELMMGGPTQAKLVQL